MSRIKVKNEIKDTEEASFEEDDNAELPPSDIVAFNELRSCADLFRMKTQGILEIKPEFQREVVWQGPAQTRFIDSLIKQLPIPSMCFSFDFKTQKWQVIDGLQRMSTIVKFLSGDRWRLSKLNDIDPKISGQPIAKFVDEKSELHPYYTRVENLTLPITVLRCDYSKKSHTNYLFSIFHRLNAGGMKLNNQEIRNCIFGGELNQLLRELNKNKHWMTLNKMKNDTGDRFKKQELILRFFAFYDNLAKYTGRLAKFLNSYMEDNRNPTEQFLNKRRELFADTVELVVVKLFDGKIPQNLSLSILEALLVGVAHNSRHLNSITRREFNSYYKKMTKHEEFSEQKLSEGLSGKPRVTGRISAAKKAFSGK